MKNGFDLPRDAEGREIPLSTRVLYFLDGRAANVRAYEFEVAGGGWRISLCGGGVRICPADLLLFPPDSWEKLERDATLAPRDYLQARGIGERKEGRIATMMADLVGRAKALAEREEAE